jgi:hypothetical protein
MNNKENSPFTPGSPVPVELFVGRSEQILEVIRYAAQTGKGKQENILLAGDKGIGKSSLASFLRDYVSTKMNLLGIHIFLGRVSTLEEMVRHIFDHILKETKEQTWFSEISGLFGKYIKEIGLFGISLTFAPSEDKLKELGVIEADMEHGRGVYRFVNEIYPIYIWMENERSKSKKD